jgi:C1A family cysteine protease
LWRGADTKRGLALCSNSWSDFWGKSGDFYVSFRDMERLILEDGEACTALEQKLKAATT